jgi:hypothetical protein
MTRLRELAFSPVNVHFPVLFRPFFRKLHRIAKQPENHPHVTRG